MRREEVGIFAALRAEDEFVEEVEQLEKEHRGFDQAIEDLDPDSPAPRAARLRPLRELDEHVERENLGIFPVTGVTLGARGWETVEAARREYPTFLPGTGPDDAQSHQEE